MFRFNSEFKIIVLVVLVLAILLAGLVMDHKVQAQQIQHHPRHRAILAHVIQHVNQVVFTPQTVFTLNSVPCTWDQVPDNTVITAIEFSPDGKTVTKVHFRKLGRTRP